MLLRSTIRHCHLLFRTAFSFQIFAVGFADGIESNISPSGRLDATQATTDSNFHGLEDAR